MKFALACDSSSVRSYYTKDGNVFTLDSKPYPRVHHIKSECMMGFWNYPALFDGYFINLEQENYPNEDFDLIFAAIEGNINYLDTLAKLYPNAKIVGTIKEAIKNKEVRNELIKRTDSFVIPYLTFDFFNEYGYDTPKTFYRIPQPVNIEYLQKHFSVNKQEYIFDYSNTWVGGHNDAHKVLYPELATCDTNRLVELFTKLESDPIYYKEIVDYASKKVQEVYSFDTVRKQIQSLL